MSNCNCNTGTPQKFLSLDGLKLFFDEIKALLKKKQDVLVDGVNIKTINGYSILGEGNINISGDNSGLSLGDLQVSASYEQTDAVTASAKLVGNNLKFSFGIPKGEDGAEGARGPKGDTGEKGDKGDTGETGAQGKAGKSAYDIACENGFIGTEEDWLASLQGNVSYDNMVATASAEETTEATAEATITGNKLKLKFGIPRGATGAAGVDGTNGRNGADGKDGAKGDKGDKGDPGEDGVTPVTTKPVFVYCVGDTYNVLPEGGHWDSVTGDFTLPTGGWSLTYDQTTSERVWMSYNEFKSTTGEPVGDWSVPIQIVGQDGTNGTDGNSAEFIYRRTKNSLEVPDTPSSENKDDYIPTNWTDNPQGITEDLQVEWVCTRLKKNEVWGAFSTPVIWSRWSVDGRDGDGVEYIFKRTTDGVAPDTPTSNEHLKDDYVPDGWTDDPTGVSVKYPYEWVCTRKYDGTTKEWGGFTGAADNPKKAAMWSHYGDKGETGNKVISMWCITDSYTDYDDLKTEVDGYRNNRFPGSRWSTTNPATNGGWKSGQAAWLITAEIDYNNELVGEWEGPTLISGVNGQDGKDGNTPNYKNYVYRQSVEKPAKPSGQYINDILDGYWVDYPTDSGVWWQCIILVNGITNAVMSIGEVTPLNGTGTESRFTSTSDLSNPGVKDTSARNPVTDAGVAYTKEPPTLSKGGAIWMITASIVDDTTLKTNWSSPVRISGEDGKDGDSTAVTGPQGPTGIPGSSYKTKYCVGTSDTCDGSVTDGVLSGTWYDTLNEAKAAMTAEKPYIWIAQAPISYKRTSTDSNEFTEVVGSWDGPVRLSGLNGASSSTVNRAPIVYPAGTYDATKSYTNTGKVTPYVEYNGNYYVLDTQMTWVGTEQKNQTPASDGQTDWVQLEHFSAIYASLAIVRNGLIGSAVFNNEWMFSQQGHYNNDLTSLISYNEAITADLLDPDKFYNESYPKYWSPNFAVNLKTGDLYSAMGLMQSKCDGTYKFGNLEVTSQTSTTGQSIDEISFGSLFSGTYNNTGGNTDDELSILNDLLVATEHKQQGSVVSQTLNIGKGAIVVNNDGTFIEDVFEQYISEGSNYEIPVMPIGYMKRFVFPYAWLTRSYIDPVTITNNSGVSATVYYLANSNDTEAYALPVAHGSSFKVGVQGNSKVGYIEIVIKCLNSEMILVYVIDVGSDVANVTLAS